jgi:uncharacterized protein (TIGR02266 family)
MTDRRKSPRFDVVLRARFKSKEQFQEAYIQSLSPGGLFLATDSPFDVGYQFVLEIHLPRQRGVIKGECEVVWVNEIGVDNYPKGMGVMFLEMSTKGKKLLEEYLHDLTDD